jgi:hypothetical protein
MNELDPELTRLFDEHAHTTPDRDAFVSDTLRKIERFQRAQMLRRSLTLALIMLLSALVAPYVAEATLLGADWVVERWPAAGVTLIVPVVCLCAALVAWRMAHRQSPIRR